MPTSDFTSFTDYVSKYIKGSEKSEAQIFLDHFFVALGYPEGLKGAGADCEFRIYTESTHTTKFADLVWKPIILIEMKKKDEDLSIHLQQAFTYWSHLVPDRPQYVILCNFYEFRIYDFNLDIYHPQEIVKIEELQNKAEAFSFLFPKSRKPVFNYNRENVTEKVAYYISHTYKSLLNRTKPEIALRYNLQVILSLFAEDVELLPDQIFTRIINELASEPGGGSDIVPKSYDLIGGLFREMNTPGTTGGGYFKGVKYFDGGLFDEVYPIELSKQEIEQIKNA